MTVMARRSPVGAKVVSGTGPATEHRARFKERRSDACEGGGVGYKGAPADWLIGVGGDVIV